MRKLFLGLLILAFVIGFTACGSLIQEKTSYTFNSDQEILAFQAMSSVHLMTSIDAQTIETSRVQRMNDDVTTSMEQIEPYLALFEQLLAQSNGLEVVTEASDLPEYSTKQVFTMKDLLGNDQTYTMYFSNVLRSEEDDDDDEDDEVEYIIEGILIHGDMTYQIIGKHEIEDDEEKIELTSKQDEMNYVEVTYKLEDDETKFSYRIYQDGVLTKESTIKIEDEDNELKIVLSYIDGQNYGDYEFKLEDEDGEKILKIQFSTMIDGIASEGEAKLRVLIDEVTNEPYYSIIVRDADDEEHEEIFERDSDDSDDDDDEDDVEETE